MTILFLCVANSSRSQMAEGLPEGSSGLGLPCRAQGASRRASTRTRSRSCRRLASTVSAQSSKSVDTIDAGAVATVVTLCADEVCPVFLGKARRLHWPTANQASEDPALSREEMLAPFRAARDEIPRRLEVPAALLDVTEGPRAEELTRASA